MISYHALTEETANGESSSYLLPSGVGGVIFVNVTAITGTLVVKLQQSPDDSVWYDVTVLKVTTSATGKFTAALVPMLTFADYTRICWTITNGQEAASATFSADLAVRS